MSINAISTLVIATVSRADAAMIPPSESSTWRAALRRAGSSVTSKWSGTNGAPGTAKHDYPYAQPVAGKPGFVTSPYAPGSGYVDVRGFPPGTEVKDPYTNKVFLVP